MFDQLKYFFVPREGWGPTAKKIVGIGALAGAAVAAWVKLLGPRIFRKDKDE